MWLYDLLMRLAGLWLSLRLRLGSAPAVAAERLSPPPAATGPVVWVHGASNGELTAARATIAALLDRRPGTSVLVTMNSLTARDMVRGWGLPRTAARLAPLDAPATVARFLDALRPSALVVIENELWPNRILGCAARGVPVLVLGGRMSERSARVWARAPRLAARLMAAIGWLMPQDAGSAARFRALGLDATRIGPVATLKAVAPPEAGTGAAPDRALTVLAASTHDGEEAAVLDAFAGLAARHPGARLILAPRHPRRRDAIEAALAVRGLAVATRSRGQEPGPGTPVYLADTLGEMALWYRAAGLCFVGGSLVDKGGHTPFEPAAHGCALLHGPHVANFAEAYAALDAAGGAVAVPGAAALADALGRLAGDAGAQAALARRATAALAPFGDGLAAREAFLAALDRAAVPHRRQQT